MLSEHLAARGNEVHVWVTHRRDPRTGRFIKPWVEDIGISPNLRTNAGRDFQSAAMGNTGSQPAAADYIALTTDATAPSLSSTTLTSEITTGGLARAQGAFTHTAGTTVYKITKTFTATGTHANVTKAGLFNASSGGTLVFETLIASAFSLFSSDTVTIEWTVNI